MSLSEEIKRGTTELLILTLLKDQDMYGYQISQELEIRSGKRYLMQESTLYPALYRLMEKGFLSKHQEKAGKRRMRVYYHLEEAGRRHLEIIRAEYLSMCRGILNILEIPNAGMWDDNG